MKRYGLDIALAVGLCALTVIGYYQVAWHDWVGYDDAVYVTQNPNLRQGLTWECFRWVWVSTRGANWHPLTMLSHAIDVQLYGFAAPGHYLTNLAFHLANVVLLYFGLQYLVRSARPGEEVPAPDASLRWKSAFVAAMFAIHPLHVESVAWIAERKDVLSTFFFFIALFAYGWYVRSPSVWRMAAVTVAMALGLMSKPMLVTLPAVLLLLDYWPLGRLPLAGLGSLKTSRRVLFEKTPLYLLSLVSSVITYQVQNTSGAVRHLAQITLDDRIANALMAYAGYVGQTFWPLGLAALYPHPGKYLLTRPEYLVKSIVALVVIVGVTAVAVWLRRSRPYVAVGWFWFLGTLVPVIGLVQVGIQSMADRYMYIPAIGLFIAVAWGVPDLMQRVPARRGLMAVVGGTAVLACTFLTWRQVQTWENSLALWSNVLLVVGENAQAHCGVATPLAEQGKLDEALDHCKKALSLAPNDPFVQHCYAGLLVELDRLDEALEYYSLAIQGNPRKALAYAGRAAVYLRLEQRQEAVDDYRTAAALEPSEGVYHRELARVLLDLKRYPLAETEFELALARNPEDAVSLAGLGNLHAQLGHKEQAISHYRRVVELAPESHEIRGYLALLLFETGNAEESSQQYAQLVKHAPSDASYQHGLGRAEIALKQIDQAIEHFREAVRLEPKESSYHLALASALTARKNKEDDLIGAIEACHAALEIDSQLTAAHYLLAEIHTRQGNKTATAEDYEAVLQLKPDSQDAANNLAWLFATSDDTATQNATRAVELAEKICMETNRKDFSFLDTLAAAYARAGRFDEAVRTAKLAIELASAARQEAMVEQIASRLKLYETGQPYREP